MSTIPSGSGAEPGAAPSGPAETCAADANVAPSSTPCEHERDRTEAALRESERCMVDIFDFLPDAALVIDSAGRVVAWNRAMEQLTGVPARAILGQGNYAYALPFYGRRRPILIDVVLRPEAEVEEGYGQLRRDGDALVAEAYVAHLKGNGVYVVGRASKLRDSKGNVVGAIEIVRDITWRKKIEEELRQSEEALLKVKDAAEAAARAKSGFLANMSHELRTPINGVLGMVGLALDTELSQTQREYLELARSSAESLRSLVNDILDISRIDAKTIELEQVDFDLPALVDGIVKLHAAEAKAKGIDLGYELGRAAPRACRGPAARLSQVIGNLLSNAIKFTEQGRVALKVEDTGDGATAGAKVHFWVEDTGVGIPADKLPSVFEAFTQADSSTTRRFGGAGLGLAISKGLVSMMGGEIWVDSKPGKGTRVDFTAVLSRAPAPAVAPPHAPSSPGARPQVRRDFKVLLGEDNAVNRRLAIALLDKLGIEPDVAEDGAAVLNRFEQRPYDLILMDIQMPNMDGVEATQRIRRLEQDRGGHVPIVAVTAFAMKGDEERFLAAGMDDYIPKPLDAAKLFSVVEKYANAPGPAPRVARESQIERTSLVQRLRGDKGLAALLLGLYCEEAQAAMRELEAAAASGDPRALSMAAHALKGSSANVSARAAASLAAELERFGRAADLGPVASVLARLQAVMTETFADAIELQQELGTEAGGVPSRGSRRPGG